MAPDIAAARAAAIAIAVSQSESLDLLDAAGRVLGADLFARHDVPPFDNSAMDGYAVRCTDLGGHGPWRLPVGGRSAAGDLAGANDLQPGTAMRIFTGAPVPAGFDAVIMQEDCERQGDTVAIAARPSPGHNIRRAGEDVAAGTRLLSRGDLLTPQRLALLAESGHAQADVFRKVRIGLISTGSELREPGEPLAPGQIHNSNRVFLRAMLGALAWAEVHDFGIIPDDRKRIEQALHEASRTCDAIVTTGGVSVGDEDHIAAIMREGGGRLDVVKVAMRPGKPVKIGLIGHTFLAGLPGNPNSALVTFRRIALPALRAMAGLSVIEPAWQPAIAGFSHAKKPDRTEFVPVRRSGQTDAGMPILELLARGSSASLSAMAAADGIALLPPEDTAIEPGMLLRFEPF
ncbi:gephyrin-like molybdotransferase Glp [Mesorhizobium sp. CAU 1741]|uniref:molybdopterin molybdotransferase MoeA n=1 Tax=Mesorhizobium sp. CAU 1741 TaxID=3140366 RepID=UPI00325B5220